MLSQFAEWAAAKVARGCFSVCRFMVRQMRNHAALMETQGRRDDAFAINESADSMEQSILKGEAELASC